MREYSRYPEPSSEFPPSDDPHTPLQQSRETHYVGLLGRSRREETSSGCGNIFRELYDIHKLLSTEFVIRVLRRFPRLVGLIRVWN